MEKNSAIEVQQTSNSIEVPARVVLSRKSVYVLIIGLLAIILLSCSVLYFDILVEYGKIGISQLTTDFFLFILAGFIAQMIDGALGMAYGVSASTFLLTFGVPPAAASASIHTSEIFTSGVSGLMHLKFKNVNKKLFKALLLPGIAGAAAGAFILSSLEEYNGIIKPVIAIYTFYLGVIILYKALKGNRIRSKVRNIPRLAAFGGLMDSIGGGGWGPIVSSTLIAKGRNPRYTIGSVNLAEFFVALSSSITFFAVIGLSYWQVIAGLVFGGVIAAPIAAHLSRRIPVKPMMVLVGIVVMLVSIRIIVKSLI